MHPLFLRRRTSSPVSYTHLVIEPDDTKLHQLAFNSGYVEKALRYLHALQLMVLIMRPAALVAAPQFTREELDELADRFTSSDSIYLADILESIMKHITRCV